MSLKRKVNHSKTIINGKLYSAENSKAVASFSDGDNYRELHETAKGNYFSTRSSHYNYITVNGDSIAEYFYYDIQVIDKEKIKELLARYNPDKYIELFGEVEEA